jgi:hypothetical protein
MNNKSLNQKISVMKKLLFLAPVLFILNGQSQNLIQSNSLLNISNINQVQTQQVFASNIMVNDNNTNKPIQAKPVMQVQRSSPEVNRQTRRDPSNYSTNNAIQVKEEVQVLQNFPQVNDNNTGEALGNEFNPIEQIASLNIPAIQVGSGNMDLNLNLDLKMPKINLKTVKFKGKGSSASKSSHHKLLQLEKKWAKFNRKTSGKLSVKKKIKFKVDNCFKW